MMDEGSTSTAKEQATQSVTEQKTTEASNTNETGPSSSREATTKQKTLSLNQKGPVARFTNKRGTGFTGTIIQKLGFDKFLFCVIC